mmetsp:Transcript_42754/g.129933  ORF Transcript_42754/g.129933 Transcript_42754/m.129933 type:complete len:186 (+) Transcript_42754:5855-6412(+)
MWPVVVLRPLLLSLPLHLIQLFLVIPMHVLLSDHICALKSNGRYRVTHAGQARPLLPGEVDCADREAGEGIAEGILHPLVLAAGHGCRSGGGGGSSGSFGREAYSPSSNSERRDRSRSKKSAYVLRRGGDGGGGGCEEGRGGCGGCGGASSELLDDDASADEDGGGGRTTLSPLRRKKKDEDWES